VAHIRHGDLVVLAIERLLVPRLPCIPCLVAAAAARVRLDQELVAEAAAAGEKPVEYAEALVDWAKAPASHRWLRSTGHVGTPSKLFPESEMILIRIALDKPLGRLCGMGAVCLL